MTEPNPTPVQEGDMPASKVPWRRDPRPIHAAEAPEIQPLQRAHACAHCGLESPGTPTFDLAVSGGMVVTLTYCVVCQERRERFGALERVAIGARLLGYEGGGSDLLAKAGITELVADDLALSNLTFQEYLIGRAFAVAAAHESNLRRAEFNDGRADRGRVYWSAAVEARKAALIDAVNVSAVRPWSHVTHRQIEALRVVQAAARDRAAHAGETVMLYAADVADALLDSRAEHRVTNGCGCCGRAALRAPYGADPGKYWVPTSALTRTLFGRVSPRASAGSTVGRVAFLVCSPCWNDGGNRTDLQGDEWAAEVLPEGVWTGWGWTNPGVLTGRLFVARVLRRRAVGEPEPEPNAKAWDHLPRDPETGAYVQVRGDGVPDTLQVEAFQEAKQARVKELADRRAEARREARKEILSHEAAAPTRTSIDNAVAKHKAPAKPKPAPKREMRT